MPGSGVFYRLLQGGAITNHDTELTAEASQLLLTRKQLPKKFRDHLTSKGAKYCTGCRRVLSLEMFRISITANGGRAGKCFECKPEKKQDIADFSIDPDELTLARSIARLRTSSRKQGLSVEVFGVPEVLEQLGLPRSQAPAIQLHDPSKGFILNNIVLQPEETQASETQSIHPAD